MTVADNCFVVTGGAGFIGTHIALRAYREGHHVVLFDNLSRKGTELNLEFLRTEIGDRLTFVRGDLRRREDVDDLLRACHGASALFHLGAQVAVTTSVKDPRADFETNAIGTLNVLEAVRDYQPDLPVIYASTNKVYGGLEGQPVHEDVSRYSLPRLPHGVPESTPLDFHSPYGCSKGAADQYVVDYSRIFGLRTVCFRQSCIYGTRQFGVEDQGWVAWFTIAAMLGKRITIFGNGKQVRDVLFVEDLVDAYWAALYALEETAGRAYNIGGGAFTISLLELIEMLEALLGRRVEAVHGDARPGDQPVYISDVRRAAADFGWTPKTAVGDGVSRLVRWVDENREILERLD